LRIVLACNTERGRRVLAALRRLAPDAELEVFCGREEGGEPAFVESLRQEAEGARARFQESTSLASVTDAHLLLMVNWRRLVPIEVCRRMRLGAFVFHDSLLPEYRGFSPTVWAIANGEDHTGVTLLEAAAEADQGDIVDQARVPIGPQETIAGVMERVTDTYLELLERNLPALLAGSAPRHPQDHSRASWARKRTAEDNRIDWSQPAMKSFDLVRAVTRPYAGAFTDLGGGTLRVWAARLDAEASGAPGTVLRSESGGGLLVAAGEGGLWLTEVSREG
jgi:methionyl-tRNA formyltransferase